MKLSIITINLNHAAGLDQTLRSVLEQGYRDFELIVIDGASTDGSAEVIRRHSARINHLVSEPDSGIYNAMNKGLRLATGEFVHFLNSGDRLLSPDVLAAIFSGRQYDADLMYGDLIRPGSTTPTYEQIQPDTLTLDRFFGLGICHQTIFYRRTLFALLGEYDESYSLLADWDFNLKVLLANRPTCHLPFPVVFYEGGGLSATQTEPLKREKDAMFRKRLPLAIYEDYRRFQELKAEATRLRECENWIHQIQKRNLFKNLAMVTLWAWRRLTRT
ncbi:MAG: glycosyltransferase family 2 protein [bacterium]